MTESLVTTEAEAATIGRLISAAFSLWWSYYCEVKQLDPEKARAELIKTDDRYPLPPESESSPEQLSWWSIGRLRERDPEAAQRVWERLKDAVWDEWESGHRAANAFNCQETPWQFAQFLVIRQSFRDEYQPRGGIEAALIDSAAQAFFMYQHWLSRLHMQATVECDTQQQNISKSGEWCPPTVGTYAAMEQTAAMTDRFHKQFIRTIRALRDLRRYPITINNPGQVNVAEQQVNLSAS